MGKKIVEKKKKKKGRPSLLDLQKRNLKEQQEQEQEIKQQTKRNNYSNEISSNPNYSSTASLRRSTRRNPNADELTPETTVDDHEDGEFNDELTGKRREKKLKLVVKLHSENSSSLNSYDSDSNAERDDHENVAFNNKKRKIVSIVEGSRIHDDSEKVEKSISAANPTETLQEAHMDLGPLTPLPDKKLLVFILDRLQKKDIYGVFSEPVDPNELPDYHEIIEHPMDFGTVREKLASRAYINLEQFEKDVLLISSNAMQYNSSDTIYYRQARAIQELAKKNFKDLRQDSDDNEPGPKVVRRGRPPTKNLKKPLGRPSLERAGSEFSPDATLATSGENTNRSNYESRKGLHHWEKPSLADLSGRFPISSNNNATLNLLTQNRFDRSDDFTGSVLRTNSVKQGKKQIVAEENRRNTYKQFDTVTTLLEPSVLNTFDRERRILLPVGLFLEHAYARSLTRFAADLGSVAWRVASKKVERSLPAGVSFGPGWVGEDDITQKRAFLPQVGLGQTSQPFPDLENSTFSKPPPPELKGGQLSDDSGANTPSDKHDPSHDSSLDDNPTKPPDESAAASSSPFTICQSSEPSRGRAEVTEGLNSSSDYNVLESSIPICPQPSIQKFQNQITRPGMNGFNGVYGFDLSAHRGKLIGASEPAGAKLQSSQMLHTIPRANANFTLPATMASLNPKEPKFAEDPSTINSGSSLLESGSEALVNPAMSIHSRTPWQGLSISAQERTDAVVTTQYKPESVPPDLNLRFKSPGSPSSSKVDSAHPDLVLQL